MRKCGTKRTPDICMMAHSGCQLRQRDNDRQVLGRVQSLKVRIMAKAPIYCCQKLFDHQHVSILKERILAFENDHSRKLPSRQHAIPKGPKHKGETPRQRHTRRKVHDSCKSASLVIAWRAEKCQHWMCAESCADSPAE